MDCKGDGIVGDLNAFNLLKKLLPKAEKFSMENIPWFPMQTPDGVHPVGPETTEDERSFWKEGLLPMPAPICWFEWSHPDAFTKSATLIFDGKTIHVADYANGRFIVSEVSELSKEIEYDHCMPLFCLLAINSSTTEIVQVPARKQTYTELRKGAQKSFAYRVVNIVPNKYVDRSEGNGTHASPRLHWRRSHLRKFERQTPGSKWHPGENCFVTVIPRCLVGRRELGEVTHEYRIK